MPRLVITKGPGSGRDHAIGTEAVVGRAPDVDFVIDDNLVSRRHVRVVRDGDGYAVEDLGSRNGTLLNGKKVVARTRLSDGDTIHVGGTDITFRQKTLFEQAQPPAAKPVLLSSPSSRPASRPQAPTRPVVPTSSGAPAPAPAAPARASTPPPPSGPPPAAPPAPSPKDGGAPPGPTTPRKRRLIS
jgi:pSer/pThr/pTyr-binding forkhead associated (FHA) protein